MSRIELSDSLESAIMRMAESNPGAMVALGSIIATGARIDMDDAFGGFGSILSLDMMGVYGSRIWMLFKDVCGQDVPTTIAMIRSVQLGILSSEALNHAIDNYGKGVDIKGTCEKVKERLPNFQWPADQNQEEEKPVA
jgi:hypothetical protein